MKNKYKILVLDGDAAHAIAIMEALKKSGFETAVLCSEKLSYGYHSHLADKKFLGPSSYDKEYYSNFLLSFLKDHPYDVLIPTSDNTAECMSLHKQELSKLTHILMPENCIFYKAYDKNKLMSLCVQKGYPHPLTIDISSISPDDDILKTFPYPALIKPNLTSGARGMTLVNNYDEFTHIYPVIFNQYGACHLQKFIPEGGRQIKVQIFTDKKCNMIYSSVIWKQRFYPVKGGSSSCNITIDSPAITRVCAQILKDIGWSGFADFDLIEDPQTREFLVMEINPRIPACIRSVFKSGIDYATMIANASLGLPIEQYTYKPGKRLRHLGFDTLWFLKSKERFKCNPSWFKLVGKNLYYQDLVGVGFISFFYGTIGNIKKILNPEFRKSKSGV